MTDATYSARVLRESRDELRRCACRAFGGLAVSVGGAFAVAQSLLDDTLNLVAQGDSSRQLCGTAAQALQRVLILERWLPPLPGRYAELKAVLYDLTSHDIAISFPPPDCVRRCQPGEE